MPESSSILFHHKSEFEYLFQILKKGFIHRENEEYLPNPRSIDTRHFNPDTVPTCYKNKIICFTDLPIERLSNHIIQYGKYIIGMNKGWGSYNGVSPVKYVHAQSPELLNKVFIDTIDRLEFNLPQKRVELSSTIHSEEVKKLEVKIRQLELYIYSQISMTRAIDGIWHDRVGGGVIKRNFYDEREWRSVNFGIDDKPILFKGYDMELIYVVSENERKEIINYFSKNLDKFELKSISEVDYKVKLISSIL